MATRPRLVLLPAVRGPGESEGPVLMLARLPVMLAVLLATCPPALPMSAAAGELVATAVSQVDDDFAFQGEYLGQVRAVDGRRVEFGVQVVALGDGAFSALGYQDGLPGNGWDREAPIAWQGAREGDLLTFHGVRGTLIIERGRAGRVIDSAGVEVGQVHKVQRVSRTLGAPPPPDAIVLFDGRDVTRFDQGRITPLGTLAPGAVTKLPVRDFQLHLEFQTPYMPYARAQARGNSGVYVQRRYEVQILDSFGLLPEFDDCGALYRQQGPDLNMTFPPLAWQTYDLFFTAARWDAEGRKTADAQITVLHNGVAIHRRRPVVAKTGAGQPESPYDGPILLQDHGNPVQFRNVWLVMPDPPSLPHPEAAPSDTARVPVACPVREDWPSCPGAGTWWLWSGSRFAP